MDLTKLPHRMREGTFRTYEPLLRAGVEAFPDVFIVDIGQKSVATVSARLRDAKTSVITYGWETDINLFILKSLCISNKDDKVLIGTPYAVRLYGKQEQTAQNQISNPSESVITLELFPLDSASLIKSLQTQKGLKKPIHIQTPILNLSELLTSLDISFIEDEKGVTILP